jgi:hypothetical protein
MLQARVDVDWHKLHITSAESWIIVPYRQRPTMRAKRPGQHCGREEFFALIKRRVRAGTKNRADDLTTRARNRPERQE